MIIIHENRVIDLKNIVYYQKQPNFDNSDTAISFLPPYFSSMYTNGVLLAFDSQVERDLVFDKIKESHFNECKVLDLDSYLYFLRNPKTIQTSKGARQRYEEEKRKQEELEKKDMILVCVKVLIKFHMENYNRRLNRINDEYIKRWIDTYFKQQEEEQI